MWNPPIPDWRSWSRFGEHGEHEKDIKKSERPVDALAVKKGESLTYGQLEIKRC